MTTLREDEVLSEVGRHRRRTSEEIRAYAKTSRAKSWISWLPRLSAPLGVRVIAPAMLTVATVGIVAAAFVVHSPATSSHSGAAGVGQGPHQGTGVLPSGATPSPVTPSPRISSTPAATLTPKSACGTACSVPPTAPPAPSTPTAPSESHQVLMGNSTYESGADFNPAGAAQAWEVAATTSGQLSSVTVNVTAPASGKLIVGVYTTSSQGDPQTLISQGVLNNPASSAAPGSWNVVNVSPAQITQGQKYWIALLDPNGTFKFRYGPGTSGEISEDNGVSNLSSLPQTWSPTAPYKDGPLEAYASS